MYRVPRIPLLQTGASPMALSGPAGYAGYSSLVTPAPGEGSLTQDPAVVVMSITENTRGEG